MLQAIQYQKTGELHVKELPAPELKPKMIVVRTYASLISAGTERTSVATAKASMFEKARTRPDLVKQVLDMAKKEGWRNTIDKVRTKLDSYKALGYSAAGVVIESACDEFAPGDHVACAGGGFASHAEIIAVPRNLAVKIPEGVTHDEAAFTTLGAIAMQGVRQARVGLGESVAVVGLGLLGQLTVQLLKAAGCRVIGLDINERQFALAREFGADELVVTGSSALGSIESFTRGIGCDAVILTAGTSSNDPMILAINAARKKGRVVVVGAVGMDIPRSPFYEKELDITISCSYGPGRYDPTYEEEGHDYPVGYVRWTERRNMESVLDLIASGKLNVGRMITHRIPITEAERAYDLITGKIQEPYIGIVLNYPDRGARALTRVVQVNQPVGGSGLGIGFIGAGSFAQSYLLPPLKTLGVNLVAVSTSTSVNARSVAEKFGFGDASTDSAGLLARKEIGAVFIATRHDTHGSYVADALEAGKQVFVEKPLAITQEELERIRDLAATKNDRVMVGFNRRFSAPLVAMKRHFAGNTEPLVMLYRVNAGAIKLDSWVQAEAQGGRIIGEGCHFIDCMQFMTGARPVSVYAAAIGSRNQQVRNADSVSITIRFSDGSVGTVHYLANGDPSVPKEYFEVFGGGGTAIMNNFRELVLSSGRKTRVEKFNGDKGHSEEVKQTIEAMKSGAPMPISFESLHDTTAATFAALTSLGSGNAVAL
ncbi:MAG: Alcohol dehydrogenase, zinc-binding protein [Chlorobi bacterium]|nr:Alcohol dehydrogenase, zinc-binding protein [Chlorobiota bacterium]